MTPVGLRTRKYVYGKTRDEVHDKWIALQKKAKDGPVATKVPTLGMYLIYWLREVVQPNMKPKPAETYDMHVRLYIAPALGAKRLDKLNVRDVRAFFNALAVTCQCCAQGKDAARPLKKQKCCARGNCCHQVLSRTSLQDVRKVLRVALNNAIIDELITKNPAALVKLPAARGRKVKPWSADEARQFLVSAKADDDPFYAAYVLTLVCGLRRGEILGLHWPEVDLEHAQVTPAFGLQRIGGKLVFGETKTEASDAPLPLPGICVAALQDRQTQQARDRAELGFWPADELVFTTRIGSAIDPRNFNRSFMRRAEIAGVRRIRVHDTRHTCGTLLAALDVHPRVAMQILRHSKIDVTMEVYTHVPSELTRRALKKLGDSLDGLAS
ncbi:MAG TPA: tyrosine-type recombinase/integrase [Jiangellaceae bacterium]